MLKYNRNTVFDDLNHITAYALIGQSIKSQIQSWSINILMISPGKYILKQFPKQKVHCVVQQISVCVFLNNNYKKIYKCFN